MDSALGLALVILLPLLLSAIFLWKRRVIAAPDEWVILIRGGKLVRSGIGISVWQWPWDQAARFTSTLQRVSFNAEALSRERIPVQIQGHLFWNIASDGDGPFRAFRALGPLNLETCREEGKHLLTRPQHHAFQQLVAAEVQRLSTLHPLEELLLDQDTFVAQIKKRLGELNAPMGVCVERVELLQVRPADPILLQSLGAKESESIRAEAEGLRLETGRTLQMREQEIKQERALAQEADARSLDQARSRREGEALAARLERERKQVEAQREAILLLAEAEEQKSQTLRDFELHHFAIEKSAEAFGKLQDARWVSVGDENPMASMLASLHGTLTGMKTIQ